MKRILCLFIALLMVLGTVVACQTSPDDEETTDTAADSTKEVGGDTSAADNTDDSDYTLSMTEAELKQWDGETFTIRTSDTTVATTWIDFEELSSDPVENAMYLRSLYLEDVMGIEFVDVVAPDYYSGSYTLVDTLVTGGDDTYDLFYVRCIESISLWSDGDIYTFDELQYVDLEKSYWAQDINPGLTLAGEQYTAVGSADLNVYDFTFALVFSKELFEQNSSLPDLYELVRNGEWTVDKMQEILASSYFDANGDGNRDSSDRYGYLADNRMVVPSFIVSCGTTMVSKDSDNYPVLNLTDDYFFSVFTKVFEIMWDDENWYSDYTGDGQDVPSSNIEMFENNQAYFLDCSFNYVVQLREMESEFGIVPYPKWDEDQEEYYARVSYFWSFVVPNTADPDFAGAVMEVLNYYSATDGGVVTAYYDQSLSGRTMRDEESQEMLDIIFSHRVADLGDTTFCDSVRDGLIAGMFAGNTRTISTFQSNEKALNKKFAKYIENALGS
ncbi:MAG: hypothetical protein LUI15_03690 [Firmicutes bacterium]|nr:hypothetical protein [Bacillota bacterium]